MERRQFIKIVGGLVGTWPIAAPALQGGELRRIGVLGADARVWSSWTAAFVTRPRELGQLKDNFMKRAVAVGLAMFAGATISATAVSQLHALGTARNADETPTWKTITLGTYRNANVLREALDSVRCSIEKVTGVKVAGQVSRVPPIDDDGPTTPFCHLEALANEIIGRPAFALSRTKTEVDLVVLSVSALGFGKQGASLKAIYTRAKSLGFAICPPEVGPQLRLQYLEQPPGEVLHIAMEPIAKYDGHLVSLSLENGEWGLVLFGYDVAAVEMYPRALFVFVKPRYGSSEN